MADPAKTNQRDEPAGGLFHSARWYDLGVNWAARLQREIPVLSDVFGPPGELGLLDAACGTGRHAAALSQAGYRVTGLDYSPDMLAMAREHVEALGRRAAFVQASFDAIPAELGLFDGVLCIGNSLSAAGSADAARRAVASMAGRLRPGGRFFIQVLNFARLRAERPAIRGPRARREAGVEYITTRLFSFAGDEVQVTSLTLWNEGGWQKQATCASLYAVSPEQMREWCEAGGLVVEAWSGSYAGEPFDAATSEDLVVVATKT